jgi:Holliday junction DNA helicase RuvA
MISKLEGRVVFKDVRYAIVDVHGVGYKVFMSPEALAGFSTDSGPISLWTYLAVRENALDLYGFGTKTELDFFELLLGVSGIGPKSAQAILSGASGDTLATAVRSGDTSYLTKVSGIGRKNAEKIVLELRDKLGSIDETKNVSELKEASDALEALQSLGYSLSESRDALKNVPETVAGTSKRVKEALKLLGKSR